MPKQNVPLLTFNRGIVDSRALSRVDIDRIRSSSALQTNWLPSVMGSMTLRPGTEYKTSTRNNAQSRTIPFIFSQQDNAAIEFTANKFRVLNDSVPLERPTVSTTITNGDFATNLSGWTDNSDTGAATAHSSAFSGSLQLQGALDGGKAILYQQITVATADLNIEHGLLVKVGNGPVTIKIGSTLGGNEYFSGEDIQNGSVSISLIPTGDFYIQFESDVRYFTYIEDVSVESGVVAIDVPYSTVALINTIRSEQSGDVIYLAASGLPPRKIIRRAARTWSLELFKPNDGPFLTENLTPITMTIGGVIGNVAVTSSQNYFNSGMVGGLFRITPGGQNVSVSASAENTFTDEVEVSGVGDSRSLAIEITGTWTATITLQRSYDNGATWEDTSTTYTVSTVTSYKDDFNNVDILYRLGIKTGDYTSGTAVISISYPRGGREGYFRVTSYVNKTSINVEVLKSPTSTSATENWAEGAFSNYRGWPNSVVLHEGRIFFDKDVDYYSSVSEAYESFDDTVEGDSAPISKTLGSGPVDSIYWMLSLNRLIFGTSGGQKELRSSSFDEPITPTDSTIKQPGTIPASNVPAIKVDSLGLFISGRKLFELVYDSNTLGYVPVDLTKIAPKIAGSGPFVRIAGTRKPETRIHCVRSDGKVAILSYDPAENLRGWTLCETDGVVEDVYVLPNSDAEQDDIFYVVNRTINGATVRYHEKWATEAECEGSTVNKNLDAHILITNSPASTTVTGLSHLEGETVYAWGDGVDLGSYTVSSGSITLSTAASSVVVGLGYTAQYKSVKLTYAAGLGTALNQRKMVTSIGFILYQTHIAGLKYGRDFNNLDDIPLSVDYENLSSNTILDEYDGDMVSFAGEHDTDVRLCLQSVPNRPCTVSAITLGITTHDRG